MEIKDSDITEVKCLVNRLIWQDAPNHMTLEEAECLSCDIWSKWVKLFETSLNNWSQNDAKLQPTILDTKMIDKDSLFKQLAEVLGLPKTTVSFVIRFAVGELPSVTVSCVLYKEKGQDISTILEKYTLVKRDKYGA